MNSKILALTLGILLTGTVSAHAHCGTCGVGEAKEIKGSEKVAAHMDKWHHKLGLSEDQAAKLEAAKKVKMDKIAAAEAEYKAALKTILNEDQMMKYNKMMDEKKSAHEGMFNKGSKKGSH